MERAELLDLAEWVLRLPTAPYHEHAVRDFVIRYCRELGVRVETDRVGNLIVKYQRVRAGTYAPLVFVAHMDHPGFEMLDGKRAEFLGGVPKEMFAKGERVRIYASQAGVEREPSTVKATIRRFDGSRWPRRKIVELTIDGAVRKGDLGMWDVPAFRVSGGKLHATAIDDVLGSVVMLATLTDAVRRKVATDLWCVFTRAEEVGFPGVLAVIQSKRIPKSALVVSIEMSKERPWARIGDGPVVRVGDRASIFDPSASAFLWRVAEQCRAGESTFRAQRCLMDGGTCEATAFVGFGYRAGGLCLPLGNYHNIGLARRPRAENVSVNDLEQLVKLTVAAAAEWRGSDVTGAMLRRRVASIARTAPRKLTRI
ncbi:MAG: M20/M25/M40 family metallo-hydrolase [Verrucomicrobiia bacterium]|jgi:endoglucanase